MYNRNERKQTIEFPCQEVVLALIHGFQTLTLDSGERSTLRSKCFTLGESRRYSLTCKTEVAPRAGREKLLSTPDACILHPGNLLRRSGPIRAEKVPWNQVWSRTPYHTSAVSTFSSCKV